MTPAGRKRRGRIRSIRAGVPSYSGSLGSDVTGLVAGGVIATLVAVTMSVWVRLATRFGKGDPHGVPPSAAEDE